MSFFVLVFFSKGNTRDVVLLYCTKILRKKKIKNENKRDCAFVAVIRLKLFKHVVNRGAEKQKIENEFIKLLRSF